MQKLLFLLACLGAASIALSSDDDWQTFAQEQGFIIKGNDEDSPLNATFAKRYEQIQPRQLDEIRIKSKTETSEGSKTYPRFTIYVTHYENAASAKAVGPCPQTPATRGSLYSKSYGECHGFLMGNKIYEVMTDALMFHPEVKPLADKLNAYLEVHIEK